MVSAARAICGGAAKAALLSFVLAALLALPSPHSARADEAAAPARTAIAISGKSGSHEFQVELAINEATRARGLMFRTSMGPDDGMLFLYKEPQRIAMWMKNTFIPLDILFIGADGTILNIEANAEPHTLDSRPSAGDALAALEINGGRAAELGIVAGDKVALPSVPGAEP